MPRLRLVAAGRQRGTLERLGPVEPHAALRVEHPPPCDEGEQCAGDRVRAPPRPRHRRPVATPVADDDVELRRRLDEFRNAVGRMLAVRVDDDQRIGRLGTRHQHGRARRHRVALAGVRGQAHEPHPPPVADGAEHACIGLGGAVVDQDHLFDMGKHAVHNGLRSGGGMAWHDRRDSLGLRSQRRGRTATRCTGERERHEREEREGTLCHQRPVRAGELDEDAGHRDGDRRRDRPDREVEPAIAASLGLRHEAGEVREAEGRHEARTDRCAGERNRCGSD